MTNRNKTLLLEHAKLVPNSSNKDPYKLWFEWASKNNFLEFAHLIYAIYGFTPERIDPHRVIAEIKLPFGEQILENWQDFYLAKWLHNYYLAANQGETLRDYPPLHRKGTARHAKSTSEDRVKSGYLTALSYSSLQPDLSRKYPVLQTMLRLWLVLHAMHRRAHDKRISYAASYLIYDHRQGIAKSVKSDMFHMLGEVLSKHPNLLSLDWDLCNQAIGEAARHLASMNDFPTGAKRFLNSIISISRYESDLFEGRQTTVGGTASFNGFNIDLPINEQFELKELFSHNGSSYSESIFFDSAKGKLAEDAEDEAPSFLTFEIDEDKTSAEQFLSGNSIYFQRLEQAYYLPWTWDRVLPSEVTALNKWRKSLAQSPHLAEQLAASLIQLALLCGRSLETVLFFPVADEAHPEWTLSPDFSTLCRKAIRRHSAYRPSSNTEGWIAPVSEIIVSSLPEIISLPLKKASANLNEPPRNLAELWFAHSEEKLFAWFNQSKPNSLSRLRSSMLANVLGQNIFNQSGDAIIARTWAAYPQNALPAATGYRSFRTEKLLAHQNVTSEIKHTPETSTVGSRLLPYDHKLSEYIAELAELITQSKTIIEHHNAVTFYVVQGLYAALGCRYLADPFESLSHVYFSGDASFTPSFIFINDKHGDLHAGRVVPLCPSAEKLFLHYISHLESLASSVKTKSPKLAENISQLVTLKKGRRIAELPLFFLLDETLNWQSVSEARELIDLPYFPLPRNTFRHRFAQRLAELGLPADILEAWQGHGERGIASYGDYSPRCWAQDAKTYLALLEAAFEPLGFMTSLPTADSLPLGFDGNVLPHHGTRLFGEKARELNRREALKSTRILTKNRIDEFLGKRTWADVSAEDFDNFVKKLITSERGHAISYSSQRIKVLNAQLRLAQSPLISRLENRYFSLNKPNSAIHKNVASCLEKLCATQLWLEKLPPIYGRDISVKQGVQLAVVLLCVEKRLSYSRLLQDVASRKNFQLFQYQRASYLRYSEELKEGDIFAAAQHHKISYQLANFLNKALSANNGIDVSGKLAHKSLQDLAEVIDLSPDCDFPDLIASLESIVDQSNKLLLPGIVAAGLSERRPPTSVSLHDLARLTSKHPKTPSDNWSESDSTLESFIFLSSPPLSTDINILKTAANTFYQQINAVIASYTKANAKETAKKIQNLCKEHSKKVSTCLASLGFWLADRIIKGKENKRGRSYAPYAKETVSTYFSTLGAVFKELAYDFDVLSASDENFYELYGAMRSYKLGRLNKKDYFGDRLRSYHAFLTDFGIPQLDWSELDFEDSARSVSSGILTETDYLTALERIGLTPHSHYDKALFRFVLLLSFRFGLRLKEATHLLRSDWQEKDGQIWVLVKNNAHRSLKSDSSRRAVPLLFSLTDLEKEAIATIFGNLDTLPSAIEDTPILSSVTEDGKLVINPRCYHASNVIIQVLREVTGNPKVVLHHARHAFLNHLAAVLLDIPSPLAQKLSQNLNKDAIISTLLGEQQSLDRRASMALAVVMGHSFPSTMLKNYNHLITDWADALLPARSGNTHRLDQAIQLDDWKRWRLPKKTKTDAKQAFATPTLPVLVRFTRLLVLGKNIQEASAIVGIDPYLAKKLTQLLFGSFVKAQGKGNQPTEFNEENLNELRENLISVPDSAWLKFFACDDVPLPETLIPIELEELPYLVGNRRHILLSKDAHFEFLFAFLESFKIAKTQLNFVAHRDSERMASKLKDLNIYSSEQAKRQVDLMYFPSKEGGYDLRREYVAAWLTNPPQESIIQTSYQLVLLLVLIVFLHNYQLERLIEEK